MLKMRSVGALCASSAVYLCAKPTHLGADVREGQGVGARRVGLHQEQARLDGAQHAVHDQEQQVHHRLLLLPQVLLHTRTAHGPESVHRNFAQNGDTYAEALKKCSSPDFDISKEP